MAACVHLLLRAMGAEAVRIDRELLPGIPLCCIADGTWAGTPLITKAGGFGEPEALARAVAAVRGDGSSYGGFGSAGPSGATKES